MSKVNLNIAYLGQTGANINLGKIDDIEITSPDNTVEVVGKTYDEATKVLTFELKAGSINDVEIISSDNSVEVVGREYNEETKVLKLDLKAAKSLTITSENETVKVTEKNGNVDLSVKQVSVAPLDATTTVELNTDASGNDTYKVGAFSSHTIIDKKNIVRPETSGGRWLTSYVVNCDIVSQNFEFFDTACMEVDFPANRTGVNSATWAVEPSNELQYINFATFSSSSFFGRIKITIRQDGFAEQTHYMAIAQDTPGDTTFTFITTLNWNINAFVLNTNMAAFLEIPSGFGGEITIEVVYAHAFSGEMWGLEFWNAEQNKIDSGRYLISGFPTSGLPFSQDTYNTRIAGWTNIADRTDMQQSAGRYKVDGLLDCSNWAVGSKIPDSLPNDIMLHTLQIYVRQLEINYAALVRQINFTSSDGSINVNPIEGGGTDYTVNLQSFYGVLEINDDNKSTYYKRDEEIVYNVPAHIQTIVINTSKTLKISAIQGDNFNGRRLTLAGNYAPSERYTIDASNTEGRFSQYLYEYRAGSVTTGASSVSWSDNIAEAFETFIYFNGIWFSKGY